MFVVSFRIPFTIKGRTMYVNGAAPSLASYPSGSNIVVREDADSIPVMAEVIENRAAGRDDYGWEIIG